MPGLSWISLAVGDEISHRLPVPCSEWNRPHRDRGSHPTQLKAASPCDLTCWHSTGGHYTLHRLRQWANSVGYYCMSVWLWSSLDRGVTLPLSHTERVSWKCWEEWAAMLDKVSNSCSFCGVSELSWAISKPWEEMWVTVEADSVCDSALQRSTCGSRREWFV